MAQMPEYNAYLVKGNVTIKDAKGKTTVVKPKQWIHKTDIITLSNGAEITLANKESKMLVLQTPGVHKVQALTQQAHKSSGSVTKKYINLIWHELLDPNYDYSKFKTGNLGGVWGGVSRGDDCNNRIFPINGLKTSEDALNFKWKRSSPKNNYKLKLYDSYANELASIDVKDTTQLVDFTTYLKDKKGRFFWLIKGEEATCEDELPIPFELLSKDEETQLVGNLSVSNNDIESALDVISKLEKASLITAAKKQFEALVKQNNNDPALVKSYVSFLLDYGMDDEAVNIWKSSFAR